MIEKFNSILELHNSYKPYIELAKDVIYFVGFISLIPAVWGFLRFLKNREYQFKTRQIHDNLEFRERFEPYLNDYIYSKGSTIRDIAVVFLHWKNYPYNYNDDAYKFHLNIHFHNNQPSYGWMIKTGVNVITDYPWRHSQSVYYNRLGIFFVAAKGMKYKGFTEVERCFIVRHLPFSNIISYDFREKVEYEPVLYVKYHYSDNRLYTDDIFLRSTIDEELYKIELSARNGMRRYSFIIYCYLWAKITLVNLFSKSKPSI